MFCDAIPWVAEYGDGARSAASQCFVDVPPSEVELRHRTITDLLRAAARAEPAFRSTDGPISRRALVVALLGDAINGIAEYGVRTRCAAGQCFVDIGSVRTIPHLMRTGETARAALRRTKGPGS